MSVAMRTGQNTALGIVLMLATVFCYTVQDGITRFLAGEYNVMMVVMVRYWIFALFVIALALRRPGGLRAVATKRPWLHLTRAALHIGEICVIVLSFTLIGLINTHAIFAVCPLLVAALSGPVLGEKVGLARWIAIGAGFAGMLVILQPGSGLFTPLALLPLLSAAGFALYSVLTRLATEREPAFTAFFWSGMLGAVMMTVVGLPFWERMTPTDWAWTLANGLVAILSNWLMIRAYQVAEAAAIQPFAYFQLVFVSIMGITLFNETIATATVIGAGIVVAAGLFSLTLARGRP